MYEHWTTKPSKPKQREKLEANKELAELSHMLGTIRKDAPSKLRRSTTAHCRGPGCRAQLLAELEMHKLTARWGLDESPAAVPQRKTLPESAARPAAP